jgi:hypothetical protein
MMMMMVMMMMMNTICWVPIIFKTKPTVKGRYVSSPGGQGCNHLDALVDEVPRA